MHLHVLHKKAGSFAFTPPGDEMNEVVPVALPIIVGEQLVQ